MAAGRRLGPLLVGCLFLACTSPAGTRSATPEPVSPTPEPRSATIDELRAAFVSWRRTEATVTYRTERQRPGLPMSAHQCLRAFVEEREDIPIALELCDPAGIVRLRLTGPGRWSIDVEEGGTITRAIVDGRRGLVCVEGDLCRRRPPSAIIASFPFHELIGSVEGTLAAAGIDPSAKPTIVGRTVGGVAVDCFDATSGPSSVRWCFDGDGILRSMRIRTEGRGPTIAEADRVSTGA